MRLCVFVAGTTVACLLPSVTEAVKLRLLPSDEDEIDDFMA